MQKSKKTLAKSLDEIRLKRRISHAKWVKANPEKNREIYARYWRRKRGYYLVSEIRQKRRPGPKPKPSIWGD
jgi:hypothetical protein